jgi:hypothetical protein
MPQGFVPQGFRMLLHCIAKAEGVTKNSRGEARHASRPTACRTFPARCSYSTWLARQTIENQVHARTKKRLQALLYQSSYTSMPLNGPAHGKIDQFTKFCFKAETAHRKAA